MAVTSLALILVLGLAADHVSRRLRLPGLIGMLLVGLALGPKGLNWLSPQLLGVSADLRQVALVVILLRAGLMLRRETLQRLGWRAIALGTVPLGLEATAVALLAPTFLGLQGLEAALVGTMTAAVSAAVVVPAMAGLVDRQEGRAQDLPMLVLAATPLDNTCSVLLFASLLDLRGLQGAGEIAGHLWRLPIAVLTGAVVGGLLGWVLYRVFERHNPRATKRALIMVSLAILLLAAEQAVRRIVPFSGLAATLAMGLALTDRSDTFGAEVATKLSKVWVFAEVALFVLLGAMVDPQPALQVGLHGALLLALGLTVRSLGAWLCLAGSPFSKPQRALAMACGVPKATVQAAVGATPLMLGFPGGQSILAMAVLCILFTAPLGAILVDLLTRRAFPREKQLTTGAPGASEAPAGRPEG